MFEPFSVSVPGKLMLLGEHAVLEDRHSLVCAVNQRIRISCTPRTDRKISIHSALGHEEYEIRKLIPREPFQFILGVLENYQNELEFGFDLRIKSDFSESVGLGSSSAVTVATVSILDQVLKRKKSNNEIFDDSFKVVLKIQGTGSGADVAACVFGGIILYRKNPLTIEKLNHSHPITVVYSGSKTPTVNVIQQVKEFRKKYPELVEQIFNTMDRSCLIAANTIKHGDWRCFGEILNVNQGLMDAIGINNLTLSQIVYQLRGCSTIFGSKISGSGLGDCVIGVGSVNQNNFPFSVLPLEIQSKGIVISA